MSEKPFKIVALTHLLNYTLRYHMSTLVSSLQENGFLHQGEWVTYDMVYTRTEIARMKRSYEKQINVLNQFLKNGVLIDYEYKSSALKDSDEIKSYLQHHQDTIINWIQVYQIIQAPGFKWSQLSNDRQQRLYEESDQAASELMEDLQIDDPQTIIDMYLFLVNSCFFSVGPGSGATYSGS